jgi:hypothetical protein
VDLDIEESCSIDAYIASKAESYDKAKIEAPVLGSVPVHRNTCPADVRIAKGIKLKRKSIAQQPKSCFYWDTLSRGEDLLDASFLALQWCARYSRLV